MSHMVPIYCLSFHACIFISVGSYILFLVWLSYTLSHLVPIDDLSTNVILPTPGHAVHPDGRVCVCAESGTSVGDPGGPEEPAAAARGPPPAMERLKVRGILSFMERLKVGGILPSIERF